MMTENPSRLDTREVTSGDNRVKINTTRQDRKKDMPKGLWTKCPECSEIIYNKSLDENLKVCIKCDYHFTLGAEERVQLLCDEDSFEPMDTTLKSADPLKFQGPKSYVQKLAEEKARTGLSEAIVTGKATLANKPFILCATDSRFIMGSMGSVVGEKLTRAIEYATDHNLPIVIVSGSGGGARMYEGVLSLMQMAKTSAALAHHDKKVFFIYRFSPIRPWQELWRASLLWAISLLPNPKPSSVLPGLASLSKPFDKNCLMAFRHPSFCSSMAGWIKSYIVRISKNR